MSTQDDFLRKIKQAALTTVVQTLIQEKQASKFGKVPIGSTAKAVESLAASGVVISSVALRKRVQRSFDSNPDEPTQAQAHPTNEIGKSTDISETFEDNEINVTIALTPPKAIIPTERRRDDNSQQASNDILNLGDSGSETPEKDDTNATATSTENAGSPMGGTKKVNKQSKNSQQSLNEILNSREEAVRKATLQGVIDDLVEEKTNRLSGGRARAGRVSYDAKREFLANMGITIKKDALYQRVNRQFEKSQQASSAALDSTSSSSKATAAKCLSPAAIERNALRQKIRAHFQMPHRGSSMTLDSTDSRKTPETDEINVTAASTPEETNSRNTVRQKVRTHFQMSPRASSTTLDSPPKAKKPRVDPKVREDAIKRKECAHAIAFAYSTEMAAKKAAGTRCKKGLMEELIAKKRVKYGVEGEISIRNIRSRLRRGNPVPKCPKSDRVKKPMVHPKTKEDAIKRNNCVYAITDAYSSEMKARKAAGRRCKKGFLEELIAKKKVEYGVSGEITISESTIQARVHAGNPVPKYIPSNKILPPVRDPKTFR